MKRGTSMIALLALLVVAVACGSTPEPLPSQTGVHLQAGFEIPESVEGQPPSHTEMDYLVLEDFVLAKTEQPKWEKDDSWMQEFELDGCVIPPHDAGDRCFSDAAS